MATSPALQQLRKAPCRACLHPSTSLIRRRWNQTSYNHISESKFAQRPFHSSARLQRANKLRYPQTDRHAMLNFQKPSGAPNKPQKPQKTKRDDEANDKRMHAADVGNVGDVVPPLNFWLRAPQLIFSKPGRSYVWLILQQRFSSVLMEGNSSRREIWGSALSPRISRFIPARFSKASKASRDYPDRAFIGPRWLANFNIGPIPAILDTARQHYVTMNESFAAGNVDAINDICLRGLGTSLASRISNRDKSTRLSWSLVDNNGNSTERPDSISAKLVIARFASSKLPGQPVWALQQVVVRLRARQVLTVEGPDTVSSKKEQNEAEYLVLQRKIIHRKVGDWYVWGHVEPQTFEMWKDAQDAKAADSVEQVPTRKAYL